MTIDYDSLQGRNLVQHMAKELRDYATHFAQRDWKYTRDIKIRHIRYAGDYSGYNHPLRRLKRTMDDYSPRRFFGPQTFLQKMGRNLAWRNPVIHWRVGLATDRHLPDGILDGGAIITHWEETGEYLQYVQPSVGALLADLMDAHPDLPEVQAIAEEMKRVQADYARRVRDGDDD